jgi:hypothetical protein
VGDERMPGEHRAVVGLVELSPEALRRTFQVCLKGYGMSGATVVQISQHRPVTCDDQVFTDTLYPTTNGSEGR